MPSWVFSRTTTRRGGLKPGGTGVGLKLGAATGAVRGDDDARGRAAEEARDRGAGEGDSEVDKARGGEAGEGGGVAAERRDEGSAGGAVRRWRAIESCSRSGPSMRIASYASAGRPSRSRTSDDLVVAQRLQDETRRGAWRI